MSQVLFTIDIRVDFRDESKLPLFKKIVQQAAQHVFAQAGLLGDAIKPEIVIHSHDYMVGHAEIALFDADIAAGSAAIGDGPALTKPATTGKPLPVAEDPSPFSDELLAALK